MKHLKENANITKKGKRIVTSIIALALFLMSPCFFIVLLGGRMDMYLDPPSLLAILIPLLFVLTVTRKFKLFFNGFSAAFFPRKETPKEICEQAAELFRLLSKTAAMAAAMTVIITLIIIGHDMDLMAFSEVGDFYPLAANLAMTLIAPFYSLVVIIFVFEPAVYILKNKNT